MSRAGGLETLVDRRRPGVAGGVVFSRVSGCAVSVEVWASSGTGVA